MNKSKLEQIINAIRESCNSGVQFESSVLTGMSAKKMVGSLQRLAKVLVDKNNCYLEVGIFQGLTLLSVAKSIDQGVAIGIDNFAYFDSDHKNLSIVKERQKKLGISNIEIIDCDYEDALESLQIYLRGRKISLFFVDGPHDYRSQLLCLLLIKPFLSEQAVIVIDDCNYPHVRQANRDFLISHPEFKLVFESYTKAHPLNSKKTEQFDLDDGWWDGVNVIVKDVSNEILNVKYPPTIRDRTLFENDHNIHGFKYPASVPKFLGLIASIIERQPIKLCYRITNLLLKKWSHTMVGKYPSMNTFSENLPSENFIEYK